MTEQEWRNLIVARLRRLRKQAGFKDQKELAEAAGVTEAAISNYIKCRRLPDAKTLLRLAHVLDCSIDDLIYVDERVE